MGTKGSKSKRGVGEKDESVRNYRISVWVTESDVIRLENTAKKLGVSKSEVVIRILRILFKITEDS